MTQVKMTIFTQSNCPKCPAVKKIVNDMKIEKQFTLTELDAASDEGYFEAIKHNIMSTPAVVIETEKETKKLAGDITKEQLEKMMKEING